MANFTPRTSEPKADSKFFINYAKGGYNTAVMIDKTSGFVLANCVGYAQGRYREICNDTKVWSAVGNNFAGNAETFFGAAQKAGFKTGQTPKLGAIIVWEGKGSAAGHVAVVEKINVDTKGNIVSIDVSQSAYGGQKFYMKNLTKASGYLYVTDGSRPLLGFIYQNNEFQNDPTRKGATPSTSATPTPSTPTTPTPTPTEKYPEDYGSKVYRVRKSWADAASQLGAYRYKSKAKACVDQHPGYSVYAEDGVCVYHIPEPKKELSASSYSDYANPSSDYYRVRKSWADEKSQLGAYHAYKSAYNKWIANKTLGYHLYDKAGKQLD